MPVLAASTQSVRPTHVQVNLRQLSANLAAIQETVGTNVDVMPILKANAYGHGLIPVARHLQASGAAAFGVAYLEEGILLRQVGVHIPILVLGGIVGDQIPEFLANDLTMTASSVDKLDTIQRVAKRLGKVARVHLKVDTGMNRIGVRWTASPELFRHARANTHVAVDGIYSHFANSDEADLADAQRQLERFVWVLDEAQRVGLQPRWRHMANSGAIFRLPTSHFDLVRPGISLYGVSPSRAVVLPSAIRPALRWVSRVVYFKAIGAGAPVSYGSTWAPTQRTRVITVPVGYGDGYFRALSGRSSVIVRGRRYPIVGRICMDQLMVDIGGDNAWNGDPVTLLGDAEGQSVSIEELAEAAGTIPYEVLTNINTRVPRVYTGG